MSEKQSPENQTEELRAQSEEENADELLEEELYADEDEDELMPPEEENEARMLNTGTIIGVIMVGVLVIFLIAFVAMNAGSRKRMLMYGKEASNRKQEIDRQHYTIPNQRPKDKHCGKI